MDFTKPTIYILAFNSSKSRYHDYYKLICEIVRNAILKYLTLVFLLIIMLYIIIGFLDIFFSISKLFSMITDSLS